MRLNNQLYKDIGIHVVNSIFTVDHGIVKVLLIKRTNEPYCGYWALPGGGLYNNELVIDGAKRELKEKTGIDNIDLKMYKIFDKVNRSPLKRMIAVAYIGVIDKDRANVISSTEKTSAIDWVDIKRIPELAYDYNEILDGAINELKSLIISSDITFQLSSKASFKNS